jgi:hypothetical protein
MAVAAGVPFSFDRYVAAGRGTSGVPRNEEAFAVETSPAES